MLAKHRRRPAQRLDAQSSMGVIFGGRHGLRDAPQHEHVAMTTRHVFSMNDGVRAAQPVQDVAQVERAAARWIAGDQ